MITLNNLYDCENILDAIENLLESVTGDEASELGLYDLHSKTETLREKVMEMMPNIN